jgi:hypothetical protein
LDIGHYFDSHASNAVVLDVKDKEAAMLVDKRLFLFGEVAFDGEKHTRQRVAVSAHFFVVILVEVSDFEEIGE